MNIDGVVLVAMHRQAERFNVQGTVKTAPFSVLGLVVIRSVLVATIFNCLKVVLKVKLARKVGSIVRVVGTKGGISRSSVDVFLGPAIGLDITLSTATLVVKTNILTNCFPTHGTIGVATVRTVHGRWLMVRGEGVVFVFSVSH